MVVLNKYYKVIGKKIEDVSPLWKCTHVLTFTVAFVSSAITAYSFGCALSGFGNNCILFPNITFEEIRVLQRGNITYPEYKRIDFHSTEWGSLKLCDFCLFSKIISAILAFIWGTFFIINPKGGGGNVNYGLTPPWQIIFPALIIIGIISIIMFVCADNLYKGVDSFCEQFLPIFNTTECSSAIDFYTLEYNENIENVHLYLTITKITIYICVVAWVCQFSLLLIRFIFGVDFKILIVTITSGRDSDMQLEFKDEVMEEELEVIL